MEQKDFIKGQMYKRIKNSVWCKDSQLSIKIGDVVIFEEHYGDNLGRFREGIANYSDMEPIDDTPAPHMVTTCDIGARVVRGRDWGYGTDASQGGENAVGTIIESAGGDNCWVLWDNGIKHVYRIGEYGRYFDLYYADEQPEKEAEFATGGIIAPQVVCDIKGTADFFEKAAKTMKDLAKSVKAETKNDGTDKTPPDPAPGIPSVMFGSKPRLMYGSLAQIQGPTKDKEARNARTEEERKRYEN